MPRHDAFPFQIPLPTIFSLVLLLLLLLPEPVAANLSDPHGISGRLEADLERLEHEQQRRGDTEAEDRAVREHPRREGLWAFLFGPGTDASQAKPGRDYDARMVNAARIAERRARARSIRRCWRFVKQALLKAEVVESYPGTVYAKQAGTELMKNFGFEALDVKNPHDAPIGAVLVYGGRGAGHVEIRTETGFVSDFSSDKPSPRPLIGVYIKPRG